MTQKRNKKIDNLKFFVSIWKLLRIVTFPPSFWFYCLQFSTPAANIQRISLSILMFSERHSLPSWGWKTSFLFLRQNISYFLLFSFARHFVKREKSIRTSDDSQVFSRLLTRIRKNYYSFKINLSRVLKVFPCSAINSEDC